MAYLHQECDGLDGLRYDTGAAEDLGVHAVASFEDKLRGFANQVSLLAKTMPFGANAQSLISTVVDRQTAMYQANIASHGGTEPVNLPALPSQSPPRWESDRLRIIQEQEDGLQAVRHGKLLLSALLLFPWAGLDTERLLNSG